MKKYFRKTKDPAITVREIEKDDRVDRSLDEMHSIKLLWSSGAAVRQVSMPLVVRLDPTESDNILDRLSAVYDDTVSTWCP